MASSIDELKQLSISFRGKTLYDHRLVAHYFGYTRSDSFRRKILGVWREHVGREGIAIVETKMGLLDYEEACENLPPHARALLKPSKKIVLMTWEAALRASEKMGTKPKILRDLQAIQERKTRESLMFPEDPSLDPSPTSTDGGLEDLLEPEVEVPAHLLHHVIQLASGPNASEVERIFAWKQILRRSRKNGNAEPPVRPTGFISGLGSRSS